MAYVYRECVMNEDTPLVAFAKCIEHLPRYVYEFVLFTLIALVSDFSMTAVAIGAVALGLATAYLWGIAAFFLIFVLARLISSMANAIGMTGQNLGAVVQRQTPPQPRIVVPSTGEVHT